MMARYIAMKHIRRLVAALAVLVIGGILTACMTNKNTINAYEGSTVTQSIDQKKTVTTTTDASVPPAALGL